MILLPRFVALARVRCARDWRTGLLGDPNTRAVPRRRSTFSDPSRISEASILPIVHDCVINFDRGSALRKFCDLPSEVINSNRVKGNILDGKEEVKLMKRVRIKKKVIEKGKNKQESILDFKKFLIQRLETVTRLKTV